MELKESFLRQMSGGKGLQKPILREEEKWDDRLWEQSWILCGLNHRLCRSEGG